MQAPGNYKSDLEVMWLQHISVAEYAILSCRKGLPASGMFSRLDYIGVHDVVRAPTGFKMLLQMFYVVQWMNWFLDTRCQTMVEGGWYNLGRTWAREIYFHEGRGLQVFQAYSGGVEDICKDIFYRKCERISGQA